MTWLQVEEPGSHQKLDRARKDPELREEPAWHTLTFSFGTHFQLPTSRSKEICAAAAGPWEGPTAPGEQGRKADTPTAISEPCRGSLAFPLLCTFLCCLDLHPVNVSIL